MSETNLKEKLYDLKRNYTKLVKLFILCLYNYTKLAFKRAIHYIFSLYESKL